MTWRKKLQNLSAFLFCPHWSGDACLRAASQFVVQLVNVNEQSVCSGPTLPGVDPKRPIWRGWSGVNGRWWCLYCWRDMHTEWDLVSGTVMSISSLLMSSLMCWRTVIMQANRLGLLQYRGNGGHFAKLRWTSGLTVQNTIWAHIQGYHLVQLPSCC